MRLQKTTSPDGTVQLEVLDPQLHPTVTHYGAGKSDVRTYLYRDYTPELAAAHGVRAITAISAMTTSAPWRSSTSTRRFWI